MNFGFQFAGVVGQNTSMTAILPSITRLQHSTVGRELSQKGPNIAAFFFMLHNSECFGVHPFFWSNFYDLFDIWWSRWDPGSNGFSTDVAVLLLDGRYAQHQAAGAGGADWQGRGWGELLWRVLKKEMAMAAMDGVSQLGQVGRGYMTYIVVYSCIFHYIW